MAKRRKNKKIFSFTIIMILLILGVCFLSAILSILNVDATQTSIVNNKLETSVVVVKNIFSKEGLINLFTEIIPNFNMFEPLVLILISLMAMGIGTASGLFKHLANPLKKLRFNVITLLVVFISVISTLIGDYGYIILIPFVAIMYRYLNKNPLIGILTVFLGTTLGYGTGLFFNYNDYTLGVLTKSAATITVDSTYKHMIFSDFYIMITATILLSAIISSLINKNLVKKFSNVAYEDELVISKKGFLYSSIAFIIILIPIIIMILPNGILLDQTQPRYIAKLFGSSSGFHQSFVYLFLLIVSICSFVYGITSKNLKNINEFSQGFAKELDGFGYLFILLLLVSILTGIINWTNIGVVLANRLLDLIVLLDLSGIPLIIISFISIILMSLLIPGSLEKWAIISPILVPIFMKGNLTPDFAQFLFKAADSVGKILTPVFVYYVMFVGFIKKYNVNEYKIELKNITGIIFKLILGIAIIWLLILVIWYIAGLPLGFGTLATM